MRSAAGTPRPRSRPARGRRGPAPRSRPRGAPAERRFWRKGRYAESESCSRPIIAHLKAAAQPAEQRPAALRGPVVVVLSAGVLDAPAALGDPPAPADQRSRRACRVGRASGWDTEPPVAVAVLVTQRQQRGSSLPTTSLGTTPSPARRRPRAPAPRRRARGPGPPCAGSNRRSRGSRCPCRGSSGRRRRGCRRWVRRAR